MKYGEDPQENALKAGGKPVRSRLGPRPRSELGHAGHHAGRPPAHRRKVETLPGAYQNYFANVRDAVNGAGEFAVKPEGGARGDPP